MHYSSLSNAAAALRSIKFVKGQTVNILGFGGQTVPVVMTQLLYHGRSHERMGVCVALLQENLTGKVCQPLGLVKGWLSLSILSGMGMWDQHGGLSRYLRKTSFYDSFARM